MNDVLELEDVEITHRKFDDNGDPIGKWKKGDKNIPVSTWLVNNKTSVVLDFYVGRRNVEMVLTEESVREILGLFDAIFPR